MIAARPTEINALLDCITARFIFGREELPALPNLEPADATPDRLLALETLRRASRKGQSLELIDLRDAGVTTEFLARLSPNHCQLQESSVAAARGLAQALARRRAAVLLERVVDGGGNVSDAQAVAVLLKQAAGDGKGFETTHLPDGIDLHAEDLHPTAPSFSVENLIPSKGIVLVWAVPNGLKTYAAATLAHQLLDLDQSDTLFGHPDLRINCPWARCLWIGTEETAGELRDRADRIVAGLGCDRPVGRLIHLWASTPGKRITLDHLPEILDKHGPVDAVILDSLTGLRPSEVDGKRISWDVDNDAANRVCLQLRGLAEQHHVCFIVLHHTGRDTSKGYRGPTDWWASADTMFGLLPREDRIEVRVEKNRHGRRIEPFLLQPTWTADAFTLRHAGTAPVVLKPSDERVLAFLRTELTASQTQIADGAELSIRSVKSSVQRLVQAQQIARTGEVVSGSPVYTIKE